MQIHILGGGAIGQLLAFHLTRALRLPSHASHLPAFLPSADRTGTTIHIRNPGIAQKLNEAGGIVTLQHNSATRSQHGIVVHGGLGALPGAPPATLPEGSKTTGSGATLQDKQKWKQILAASSRHQLRTHELQQRDVLRSGISIFDPQQGSDAHIDTLFLCTKADTASFALESLLPRLSPRSTVVLTQNGLGLADILIAKHFPDPARRPWIILSSLTHGLYRTRQDALHAVHASLGDIQFAVLPDLRCRSLPGGMERRAPWPSPQHSNSSNNIWPPDTLSLEHIDNYFASLASRARPAYYNTALPNEDEERPPHEASSLVHTISLLLAAEELKANWIPLPDFHRRALRKLAINACINPLTALLECQNGALSGGPPPSSSSGGDPTVDGRTSEAQRERGRECVGIMKDVCQEISAVVQERAERTWWASRRDTQRNEDTPASWSAHDVLDFTSSSQTDESSTAKIDLQPQSLTTQSVLAPPQDHQSRPPPLHPTLTSEALFTEVQRVLDLVRENYSSMYQDVVLNGRASSEVSFVNGYVRRLGDGLNEEFERAKNRSGGRMVEGMKEVRTPINRMLERLIVAKCDLFGSLARPQSSPSPEGKVTRSRSFPTVASNKVRKQAVEIEVPGREKVGFRKKRAGGFGRGWEERKLLAFFRMKEARELERKGEGAGGRKEVVVQVEEERGEGDEEGWRDEQEELERGDGQRGDGNTHR
ncbi:hypothetical protein CF326_g4347 [Tilletia indica]|nr:hypothetical protein CF326_g4347 [Tilletia indica]